MSVLAKRFALLHSGITSALDPLHQIDDGKAMASFAGPMRLNLISMLDTIGIPDRLGIHSTAELWASRNDLVQFTSVLRYPVFETDENFGGNGLMRSRFLVAQVESWFATEAQSLRNALFIPLGPAVLSVCTHLLTKGVIKENQILRGLPHPSGANAERIAYFMGRKSKELLSIKTNSASIDAGRELALKGVSSWK